MEENPDKVLTFPIEFLHNPHLQNISPAAMGCYTRIIMNYWLTGQSVPESETKLHVMSMANHLTWKWVKDQVREALRVTMPKIIKERQKRREAYLVRLNANRPRADSLMKYNEARRREKAKGISDSMQQEQILQPVKQTPYTGDGRSDEHKLRELRQRVKVKKPMVAKMFDKTRD